MIAAATNHVGLTKPGKRTKSYMNPTVRAAIRKRNTLRRNVRTHRDVWLEACTAANEEIKKAKENKWKETLESTINDKDGTKIWKLIKSLNGCPESNAPNEVLNHKGKVITSNKKKSNIFIQQYADISKLSFDKKERALNRETKEVNISPKCWREK